MAAGLAGCNSAKSCGVVKQLPIDPSDSSEPVAPDSPPTLRIHPPVYLTHLFRPSRVAAQDYNRCRQFHATRFQIGNQIYFKSNRDPFSFYSSFYLFLFSFLFFLEKNVNEVGNWFGNLISRYKHQKYFQQQQQQKKEEKWLNDGNWVICKRWGNSCNVRAQ